MRNARPSVFTFLGAALFIIGFVSLLSIIAGLQFGQGSPWQLDVYTAMDFLLCWGFFKAQYWLPLLAVIHYKFRPRGHRILYRLPGAQGSPRARKGGAAGRRRLFAPVGNSDRLWN